MFVVHSVVMLLHCMYISFLAQLKAISIKSLCGKTPNLTHK